MKKIVSLFLIAVIGFVLFGYNNDLNSNNFEKFVFENECFGIEGKINDEIFENIEHSEKYQVVLELYDNYEPLEKPTKELSIEEAKEFLRNNRERTKEHYSSVNKNICEELGLYSLEGEFEISNYSPFIFVTYENIDNYDVVFKKLVELSEKDQIIKIYINRIENWKNDISPDIMLEGESGGGGGTPTYTGDGVVIGILEPGVVIASNSNFADINLTVRDEWYYIETETEHATTVASIAGGRQGIAPDADILSVEVCGNLSSEVEWLLEHNVNVVNMSFYDSAASSSLGNYTSKAAYIDSIVRNNYVTFVGSAGNRGGDDDYVTSPKTGYNVIAVGSTNESGTTLSSFSSFKEKFIVTKPNLVACGENYVINEIGNQGSGTSYASPVVTGTVALMMEKRPNLIFHPELVMTILTANADNMVNYSDKNRDGFNDKVGAGFINIDAALTNIDKSVSFRYSTQNQSGVFVSETSVSLSANQTIKISFASIANTNRDNNTNKITDYDLGIYKSDGTYLDSITSISNTELLEYQASTTGTYIIKIYIYSAKKTELTDFCGYAYKIS